ncbi:fibronectin type III domain-containing protein [Mesorhizobium sp. B2-1-2]|uniref:fibronectin type III domain-containing protein n=1 Tax=Mesorhizobium sp. B2-1-2 TaxID=2589973 RepID=UPI0011263C05|nr:fibronectin type III domain-containing protein [Mesorhizobium sp. B2-1-2]TPN04539.1 hypothetical protein FJ971_29805 [Mesorhizobium sp. B2-1-2]
MPVSIAPIENGESGLSVRQKLNLLFAGAAAGSLGSVSPEELAAMFDHDAPAVPTGLVMDSVVADGQTVLTIAWDFNSEEDFLNYDLQIKEADGPWLSIQTAAETEVRAVKPNATYSARVRAIDKSGNVSAFCPVVMHTTAKDTIPPAMPVGLQINAGLESIWLTWVANVEADLAKYEIYESAVDVTPLDTDEPSHTTLANNFVRAGLDMETHLYFWVRAVDTSGNKSPWSAQKDAETGKIRGEIKVALTGVTFAPGQDTGDRLTWTAGSISYGVAGDVPTVQALPAGQVDWTADTVYVCFVPGDDEITTTTSLTALYAADSVILGIYKGGTDYQVVEGKAFMDGGLLLAQTVGANQLVTNAAVITGAAQIAEAVIDDAHIVDLDAFKLKAGSTMTGSLLVNGAYRLDDGGALVNGGTTKVLPGQIYISDGTSLTNWIVGTGTYMDGAMIGTGTITAEKAVFGQRGLTIEGIEFQANSPTTNKVSWSAGTIKYIGDDGNIATFNITGSNATWSSGTLYIYYVKGTTTLAATAAPATAFQSDRVVLSVYRGGIDLVTDYGRVIIENGWLKAGSITADKADIASFRTSLLVADVITASMINVANLAAISATLGAVNISSAIIGTLQVGSANIANLSVTSQKTQRLDVI